MFWQWDHWDGDKDPFLQISEEAGSARFPPFYSVRRNHTNPLKIVYQHHYWGASLSSLSCHPPSSTTCTQPINTPALSTIVDALSEFVKAMVCAAATIAFVASPLVSSRLVSFLPATTRKRKRVLRSVLHLHHSRYHPRHTRPPSSSPTKQKPTLPNTSS